MVNSKITICDTKMRYPMISP